MSQTETPLTPPLRPGPLYPLLPDESDDILVDVADMVPNAEQWLDARNSIFAGDTPRSLIGTDREWLLHNFLRMAKYGPFHDEPGACCCCAPGRNGRCGIGPSNHNTGPTALATGAIRFRRHPFQPRDANAIPAFPILYLAENHFVALLRSWRRCSALRRLGRAIRSQTLKAAWRILNVQVALAASGRPHVTVRRTNQTGHYSPGTDRRLVRLLPIVTSRTPVSGHRPALHRRRISASLFIMCRGWKVSGRFSARMPRPTAISLLLPTKLRPGSRSRLYRPRHGANPRHSVRFPTMFTGLVEAHAAGGGRPRRGRARFGDRGAGADG